MKTLVCSFQNCPVVLGSTVANGILRYKILVKLTFDCASPALNLPSNGLERPPSGKSAFQRDRNASLYLRGNFAGMVSAPSDHDHTRRA
jgi:hypothetical protein